MYFQRLSGDRRRGIIIPKRPAPGTGHDPAQGPAAGGELLGHVPGIGRRPGADGRRPDGDEGSHLEKMPPGELIYLNLPLHPGSKLDRQPPTSARRGAQARRPRTWAIPGVELTWKPAADDNWISYYEVLRDGQPHRQGGQGNVLLRPLGRRRPGGAATRCARSTARATPRRRPRPADSPRQSRPGLDDADADVIRRGGIGSPDRSAAGPCVGTISTSKQTGAALEVAFEGQRMLWFSKLGDDCGKAEVSVDGGPPESIDTYSADDIWGVCVFRKEFPTSGKHVLRIEVSGERHPRAKDALVHCDGFRVE